MLTSPIDTEGNHVQEGYYMLPDQEDRDKFYHLKPGKAGAAFGYTSLFSFKNGFLNTTRFDDELDGKFQRIELKDHMDLLDKLDQEASGCSNAPDCKTRKFILHKLAEPRGTLTMHDAYDAESVRRFYLQHKGSYCNDERNDQCPVKEGEQ